MKTLILSLLAIAALAVFGTQSQAYEHGNANPVIQSTTPVVDNIDFTTTSADLTLGPVQEVGFVPVATAGTEVSIPVADLLGFSTSSTTTMAVGGVSDSVKEVGSVSTTTTFAGPNAGINQVDETYSSAGGTGADRTSDDPQVVANNGDITDTPSAASDTDDGQNGQLG